MVVGSRGIFIILLWYVLLGSERGLMVSLVVVVLLDCYLWKLEGLVGFGVLNGLDVVDVGNEDDEKD